MNLMMLNNRDINNRDIITYLLLLNNTILNTMTFYIFTNGTCPVTTEYAINFSDAWQKGAKFYT